jgi:hypothetical protein
MYLLKRNRTIDRKPESIRNTEPSVIDQVTTGISSGDVRLVIRKNINPPIKTRRSRRAMLDLIDIWADEMD